LLDVKAKRAALEQTLMFNDAIQEHQRLLNKLQIQKELSETIAQETVYADALRDEVMNEDLSVQTGLCHSKSPPEAEPT